MEFKSSHYSNTYTTQSQQRLDERQQPLGEVQQPPAELTARSLRLDAARLLNDQDEAGFVNLLMKMKDNGIDSLDLSNPAGEISYQKLALHKDGVACLVKILGWPSAWSHLKEINLSGTCADDLTEVFKALVNFNANEIESLKLSGAGILNLKGLIIVTGRRTTHHDGTSVVPIQYIHNDLGHVTPVQDLRGEDLSCIARLGKLKKLDLTETINKAAFAKSFGSFSEYNRGLGDLLKSKTLEELHLGLEHLDTLAKFSTHIEDMLWSNQTLVTFEPISSSDSKRYPCFDAIKIRLAQNQLKKQQTDVAVKQQTAVAVPTQWQPPF